jgi:ATP-dependent 26S proteasome regulatory subunit
LNVAEATDWQTANQRYLLAELARVKAALASHAGHDAGGDDVEQAVAEAAEALPGPSAFDVVRDGFGLSSFEGDVVLLCAGWELDDGFHELCPAGHPTFGLALATHTHAHWSALSPDGALRRWRLVEPAAGAGLASAELRIDERVLHHLTGVATVDDRLRALVTPLAAAPFLSPSRAAAAEQIAALWTAGGDGRHVPLPVQVTGPDLVERRAVAVAACRELGLRPFALAAADVPAAPAEREALARLWEREAVLGAAALVLECEDDNLREVVSFLESVQAVRLVSTREPLRSHAEPILRVDLPALRADDQRRAWREALPDRPPSAELDAVVQQFRLGAGGVEAAVAQVLAGASVWDASRAQARPRLDDLAQRIEPAARWDDLVLPEAQLATLREVAIHIRRRTTVYEDWGFAARGPRGLGISALFAGPSGTGKTMGAEVLANDLRLDLYRIDLSAVVSKYIGETEKNLRSVFDAAEEGGAILLFDEADALFGKRSEVRDSHDRYANIEVSYLLQRMEAYRGLAILTTNQKSALDPSFLRRLRFVVQFPFPDAAQRAEIWSRMFPAETPTDRLDFERLARLNVSGGNIRNVALGAAFLAAEDGGPVRMSHLLHAARSEYAKLEKPLTEAEIGGWS